MRLVKAFSIGACMLGVVEALFHHAHTWAKRQVTELRDQYDFVVVVGGGTAGLTVAHRVSAAFPNRTVLVIEYGKIEGTVGYLDPPEDGRGASRLVINSPPVASVNNRSATVILGMTVGGGSVVNGQFLDRGSRYDYDEWARLGSPEFDDSPYVWFKKSLFLAEPSDEHVDEYGYTWDASAYAGDSTQASFLPFQWPIQRVGWRAYEELGLETRVTCDDGDKHGVCWVPSAQNSETVERSHAGVGHCTRVADSRPNLDLLVGHKVMRLVIEKDEKVPAIEFRPVANLTTHGALIKYVKDTFIQSLMHPCCTAAMLPREKGGVVDSSLSVYGISGLRWPTAPSFPPSLFVTQPRRRTPLVRG